LICAGLLTVSLRPYGGTGLRDAAGSAVVYAGRRRPASLVAAVLRGARRRRAALAVTALGIGAVAGAIGTGLAEPLPPAT
jgi:hypothetical protein